MAKRSGLRVDAARNQVNILRAARTLIAQYGAEVGMDSIAREAGVAVGTLYRHFPTKTDLVNAIMAELGAEVAAGLDAAVSRIKAGESALQEIATLLHRVAVELSQDRRLRDVAARIGAYSLDDIEQQATIALREMIAAGHREGLLRPDVTADDLALLLTTTPRDNTPLETRQRWVILTLRSLTAGELPELRFPDPPADRS